MANVLITGGAGYLGGALTDILTETVAGADYRHNFLVYDSLVYEEQYLKNVPFVNGDIRDTEKLAKCFEWADVVVWLAALVGDGACAIDPASTLEVNYLPVVNLARNFKGRIIFTSTCSVYGASEEMVNETGPVSPLSVYASTKLAAESALADHDNVLILRLGTLFGQGDSYSRIRFDLVVNSMTLSAVQKGRLMVFGGDQYRPLIHVRDVAEFINFQIDGYTKGVINVGGRNYRIRDLAEEIKVTLERLGQSVEINHQESLFEDSRNYRVESRRAEMAGLVSTREVGVGVLEIFRLIDEKRVIQPEASRYKNETHLKENKRWLRY